MAVCQSLEEISVLISSGGCRILERGFQVSSVIYLGQSHFSNVEHGA